MSSRQREAELIVRGGILRIEPDSFAQFDDGLVLVGRCGEGLCLRRGALAQSLVRWRLLCAIDRFFCWTVVGIAP